MKKICLMVAMAGAVISQGTSAGRMGVYSVKNEAVGDGFSATYTALPSVAPNAAIRKPFVTQTHEEAQNDFPNLTHQAASLIVSGADSCQQVEGRIIPFESVGGYNGFLQISYARLYALPASGEAKKYAPIKDETFAVGKGALASLTEVAESPSTFLASLATQDPRPSFVKSGAGTETSTSYHHILYRLLAGDRVLFICGRRSTSFTFPAKSDWYHSAVPNTPVVANFKLVHAPEVKSAENEEE